MPEREREVSDEQCRARREVGMTSCWCNREIGHDGPHECALGEKWEVTDA